MYIYKVQVWMLVAQLNTRQLDLSRASIDLLPHSIIGLKVLSLLALLVQKYKY
jgi:hypothetical protein